MSLELCASALRKASSDNDRLAALLVAGRKLADMSAEEARTLLAEIDLDFVRRLLLAAETDEESRCAQRSLGLSLLGQLADKDSDALLTAAQLPGLLQALQLCLLQSESRQLAAEASRVAFFLIDRADNGAKLASTQLLPVLCHCATKLCTEWQNCAQLAIALLARASDESQLTAAHLQAAAQLLRFLSHELAKLLAESMGDAQIRDSHDGKSQTGKSKGDKPREGISCDEKPQRGKYQEEKSPDKDSQEKEPPTALSLLQLCDSLLNSTLPCDTYHQQQQQMLRQQQQQQQLTQAASSLLGQLPQLLASPALKTPGLSLAAKLVDAGCLLRARGEAAEGEENEDVAYLVASLAALELQLRLEPDGALLAVAEDRQQRQLLTACFVIIEASVRSLLDSRLLQRRPQLLQRLLSQLDSGVGRLAECLAALLDTGREGWKQLLECSSPALFMVACIRCSCLWLCEASAIRQQLPQSGRSEEAEAKLAGKMLQLFSSLLDCRQMRSLDYMQFGLAFICQAAELQHSSCQLAAAAPLLEYLLADYLSDCLGEAVEGNSKRLMLLVGALLNFTLPALQQQQQLEQRLQQRLIETAEVLGARCCLIGQPDAKMAAIVLGLSCLRLAPLDLVGEGKDSLSLLAGSVGCIAEAVRLRPNGRAAISGDLEGCWESAQDYWTLLLHLTAELLAENSGHLRARLTEAAAAQLDEIGRIAHHLCHIPQEMIDFDADSLREYLRFVQIVGCLP